MIAEQFHTLGILSSVLFGASNCLLIFPFLPHFVDKYVGTDAIFFAEEGGSLGLRVGGLRGGIGLAKDKPGHSPLTLGPEGSGQGWGLTHFILSQFCPQMIIAANFQSE